MNFQLKSALQGYLADEGRIERFEAMADGHAGLTYGFTLARPDGDLLDCILKKAPDGVPRGGSTDIFRQAMLLRELHATGFPAPDVLWASGGDEPLGAPFIVMTRLAGRSVIVWAPSPASVAQFREPADVWTEAAGIMGRLHAVDWRRKLETWQRPTSLNQELDRWTRLLRHTADAGHLRMAHELADQLRQRVPPDDPIGLLHGDLQPGNVLYENGLAVGVIDWDLASIGSLGMDIGWLLMVADSAGWSPNWRPFGAPGSQVLLGAYMETSGSRPEGLDWHQAFACFRMAAITGLNLKLHRDGRRPDPIWERFEASVPFLLERGCHLAQSPQT